MRYQREGCWDSIPAGGAKPLVKGPAEGAHDAAARDNLRASARFKPPNPPKPASRARAEKGTAARTYFVFLGCVTKTTHAN